MGHKLLFCIDKDTSVETFEKNIILYVSFATVRWVHVHHTQNLVIATIFEKYFLYAPNSDTHFTIIYNLIFTASLFFRRGNWILKYYITWMRSHNSFVLWLESSPCGSISKVPLTATVHSLWGTIWNNLIQDKKLINN